MWDAQEILTDDLIFDRTPLISAGNNGTAMLTWVSNAYNDLIGSIAEPNDLLYSIYNGTNWGTPSSIASNVSSVVKSSMAYNGTEATLLFIGDMDDDTQTPEDRELFAVSYIGGVWGTVQQLTNDIMEDANPQVAYDHNGDLLIVWYKDGDILMATDLLLTDQTVAVDLLSEASAGVADFRLASGASGQIGLIWQEPSEDLVDMWYSVYLPNIDPNLEQWSKAMRMTKDDCMEYAMAPVYNASGELVVAYNKAIISYETQQVEINGNVIDIENVPVVGQVDLYALWHTSGGDLAVFTEDITLTPANPLPGEMATITARIKNLGDIAAKDAIIEFYDEGMLIDTAIITEALIGGNDVEVSVDWTVPSSTFSRNISVSINPNGNPDDVITNNLAVVTGVMKPDATISSILVQKLGTKYILTVRVTNSGALDLGPVDVNFYMNKLDGLALGSVATTETLVAGAFQDVTFQWQQWEGDRKLPSSMSIYAVADETEMVDEYDEENNSRSANLWNKSPSSATPSSFGRK